MEAQEINIQDQLQADCRMFVLWTNGLSDEQLMAQVGGKWSAAEVMQHLYLSARPVARLLAGPRDALTQWGRAELPSRSYNELATTYQNVLATGVKAPASMSPRPDDVQVGRGDMLERFTGVYDALVKTLDTWLVDEPDVYCIPHPVLGKLTVREMLYFTSVHTHHHLRLLQTR